MYSEWYGEVFYELIWEIEVVDDDGEGGEK